MTIEQLLSPAVMEWSKANRHLSKEQSIEEFDKWFADNIDLINESVKDNIDEINESLERGKSKLSNLLIENADENHVNSDAETKENKDSNTIMTQVKLFEKVRKSNIEECVNQFLQENANSIKVIDIKYTTYVPSERSICVWTAMVIYETL